jgi:hypothetical protein
VTGLILPAGPRWRQWLLNLLLLPLALLVIVAEDLLWRGARSVLLGVSELPAVGLLRNNLARLSGWAALPLFLVPEIAGRIGELWVAVLLYRGHLVSAVLVYALVRLVATLIAVFIWQACSVALLRLRWFALIVGWVTDARDWTFAKTARLRARVTRLTTRAEGGLLHRVHMLRHMLLQRTRGR